MVCSSIFLALTFSVTIIVIVTDGWASWQVVDDVLIVKKLFCKTKRIHISEIKHITEIRRLYYGFYTGSVSYYQIASNNSKTIIPVSKESKLVVKEIKERYGIEVSCEYKKADEDDDW